MEKEIISKSVEEVMVLIDRGKLSTSQVNKAYKNKMCMYKSYWLNNGMIKRKRGHIQLQDKYNTFMDEVKKRSPV